MFLLIRILPADAGVSVVSGHLSVVESAAACNCKSPEVKSNRFFYALRSPSNDVYV